MMTQERQKYDRAFK